MQTQLFFRSRIVLALLLALCAMPLSSARAQDDATIEVGILDEDKLAAGYTKYREAVIALDTQVQALDTQLDSRELLNEAEGKRFDELIVKDKLGGDENTELQNIIKAGSSRRAEMLGLVGKAARTPDDNKRLKELNDGSERSAARVRAIQDKLYDQIKKNQQEIDKQYTSRANQVIEQVAADQKLSLIWRKRAIIWHAASIDITGAVLKKLNQN